jgi:hypothetical protein
MIHAKPIPFPLLGSSIAPDAGIRRFQKRSCLDKAMAEE